MATKARVETPKAEVAAVKVQPDYGINSLNCD